MAALFNQSRSSATPLMVERQSAHRRTTWLTTLDVQRADVQRGRKGSLLTIADLASISNASRTIVTIFRSTHERNSLTIAVHVPNDVPSLAQGGVEASQGLPVEARQNAQQN